MPKGRPRKSPQEKFLEGSRARIQVEVFTPRGAPFVPAHLNDDAQACAEHIIKNFSPKCISSLDSYCLAVFAAAWGWHKRAVHEMSPPDFQPVVTRKPATRSVGGRVADRGVNRDMPGPLMVAVPLMSAFGVKRTWTIAAHMSAFDPKRTLAPAEFAGRAIWNIDPLADRLSLR
jgi:hypothetical protein